MFITKIQLIGNLLYRKIGVSEKGRCSFEAVIHMVFIWGGIIIFFKEPYGLRRTFENQARKLLNGNYGINICINKVLEDFCFG